MTENLLQFIERHNLSIRTARVIRNLKVKTFQEIAQFTITELLKHRNLGRKTLKELQEALAAEGLKLYEGRGCRETWPPLSELEYKRKVERLITGPCKVCPWCGKELSLRLAIFKKEERDV